MSDDIFANLPPKARELGTPVAHYRTRPAESLLRTALRVLTYLVVGAAVIGLAVSNYTRRGDEAGAGTVALLVLGLFFGANSCFYAILVGLMALLSRRDSNVRGVVHCPGGLICVLPDKCVVAPWDEIDWVWDFGERFRTRGGAEVTLPLSLEGRGTLGELLQRETFQRLVICASAGILGGRAVEFGPITLTRDEIIIGGGRVAWSDVSEIGLRFRQGLCVFRRGERSPALSARLADVPNVNPMLALVERLRERGFGSIVIGRAASEPPEPE
jgi:hypothetical protein